MLRRIADSIRDAAQLCDEGENPLAELSLLEGVNLPLQKHGTQRIRFMLFVLSWELVSAACVRDRSRWVVLCSRGDRERGAVRFLLHHASSRVSLCGCVLLLRRTGTCLYLCAHAHVHLGWHLVMRCVPQPITTLQSGSYQIGDFPTQISTGSILQSAWAIQVLDRRDRLDIDRLLAVSKCDLACRVRRILSPILNHAGRCSSSAGLPW